MGSCRHNKSEFTLAGMKLDVKIFGFYDASRKETRSCESKLPTGKGNILLLPIVLPYLSVPPDDRILILWQLEKKKD